MDTSPPPSSPFILSEDFVIALHEFSASSSGSNTCLSFHIGQVIRVLNRDGSGWWDGETVASDADPSLTSPSRGWFPSNYVTPLESSMTVTDSHSQMVCNLSLHPRF